MEKNLVGENILTDNEYFSERKVLVELEADSYRKFDTTLLTLSSGAIALSITFIKNDFSFCSCLLKIAWALWLITISTQLMSHLISAKAIREDVKVLKEKHSSKTNLVSGRNKFTPWVNRLNLSAVLSFVIGAFSFIIFVMVNYDKIP
jgi:hypothetical protein